MIKKINLLLLFCISLFFAHASDSELYKQLQRINGITFTKIDNVNFNESYELMVPQLIDHNHPEAGQFKQRVFLFHTNFSAPMVFVTEGYFAGYALDTSYNEELAGLLKSNLLVVEHRNFGKSIADTITWQTMTVEQAAADHHAIFELLKPIYQGKWIATGVSKGGQTSLYYKVFYPNDMDATVAYVAPLNFSLEDNRVTEHLLHVGTKECRDKIFDFQLKILKHKKELLPMFISYCQANQFTLVLEPDVVFDYEVLEYPFGFWQYGTPCDSIPPDSATDSQLLYHLVKVTTPFYYSVTGVNFFKPFFYQANYQLGYYGYNEEPFKDYLKLPDYSNSIWGPANITVNYKPETMEQVRSFLQTKGNHIIYIYGEYDPWSATQVELTGQTDALKIIIEKGNHSACISQMNAGQKEAVYKSLERWLDVKIDR